MILANLRASAWKYSAIALAGLAVAALIAALIFRTSAASNSARADAADEQAQQSQVQLDEALGVIATERAHVQGLRRVAAKYEQDKVNAQAKHDAVVAGLRSGQLRLRQHWQGCPSVPSTAAGASESDDAEQRRSQGAGDLVRLAAEWDAKERALQAVTQADRK